MAARLIWSPRSLNELDEILDYISKDSPRFAGLVGRRMFARAEALRDQPRLGRRVPEYEGASEYREVFVHSWRLIYSIGPGLVTVIAIVHGARSLDNIDPL